MDEISYSPVYNKKTLQILEEQFNRIKDECYVDHAGATLYADDQIKKSFNDLSLSFYTNPHSYGINGKITEETVDNIRCIILDHFHTNQDEYNVIFTSGATASLKLVAETFNFKNEQIETSTEFGSFVYLQDNHTSVLGMRDLSVEREAKVICISHECAFKILQQTSNIENESVNNCKTNSLFVYSAQCNFSGFKYPLNWIEKIKNGSLNSYIGNETNWFTFLDAASFAATNDLDLSVIKPDFVCLSFYKLFGYPTGIGALLVKNDSAHTLKKTYYGGGTVDVVLSSKIHHVKKMSLHDRFEDGTISFLSIVSLQHGFKILSDISMDQISEHVFSLARYLHHSLLYLHHENGNSVVELYSDTDYENKNLQGGIVSFNVLRDNGEYVGYMEVINMAALYKIHLRTGCFCNPGACQRHLNLSDDEILKNYDSGYTCGGTKDIIDSKPTGAVRISFGYMSSIKDVEIILKMFKTCFVSGKSIMKCPLWWSDYKLKVIKKYATNVVQNTPSKLCANTNKNNVKTKEFSISENNSIIQCNRNVQHLKLSKMFIYPVKSCGGFEIKNSWELTSKGLKYDREWMIITSTGVCLTQKQDTKLCLITPVIDLKQNELNLQFPGMPSIQVPLIPSRNENINITICKGKICGHRVEGIDCGADVSEWLSLALGRPNLRLIRQTESNLSKKTNQPDLSFASQSQYLLINEASVLWLSDRISENSEFNKNTMLHRFRGNFYIDDCTPFEETKWKTIQIGSCFFKVQGKCTRCQMICIDQFSGEKTVEPLRTLAENFHGQLTFGIYLVKITEENKILKVGDEIYCR